MASGKSTSPKTPITDRSGEPVLQVDEIQGNIFPGFNKDHQTLLFFRIDDPTAFRIWLGEALNRIASTSDVLEFNRLYKRLRHRLMGEEPCLEAVWANIAFSFSGLKKCGLSKLDEFVDEAFKVGHLTRSMAGELGDPVGSDTAGDPKNWLIGGPEREADVVLLLAGDDRDSLNEGVSKWVERLFPHHDENGKLVCSGATVLFRQDGDTLTGAMSGHEHFGFKDGISQPGIRGKLDDGTFLTPSQNPLNPNQGKPGQDLLWPGEFVFGYQGQDPNAEITEPGLDPLKNKNRKAPDYARNGSFLVFRRLRQNVGGFHRFLGQLAKQFGVSPELIGSKMVGRWPSGAPTVITPNADDPILGDNACQNNNFEFAEEEDVGPQKKVKPLMGEGVCENVTEPEHDPDGSKLPFAGHIRKTYPRNDESDDIPELGESTTQTHRLLRRGIPFGSQSPSSFSQPQDDTVDRGLLFMAYQVSIVDQFEFVTKMWANNPDFKDGGTGFDPIIGQNGAPDRKRFFKLGLPGEVNPIETDQDWVIPTGGGYFFAPSIATLKLIAALQPAGGGGASPKKPPKK